MRVSFNMLARLFDVFVYFKKRNFTVTKEFKIGDVTVKEYTYNLSRYYTDTWPPNTSAGSLPIHSVIRDDDGLDVTKQVLKFSGPRKNYVNPLGTFTSKKKIHVNFVNLGVQFKFEETWVPYTGKVTVTDILGGKRTLQIDSTNFKGSSTSEIHENTVRVPSGS